MKRSEAGGNTCKLCCLIRHTGPRKPGLSEVIKESDNSLIHSQEGGLELWTDDFREQFSWSIATMGLPLMSESEPMQIDSSITSETGMIKRISFLK